MPPTAPITYRSSRPEDIPFIAQIIEPYVADRKLMPRGHDELSNLIPNGFVAEADGQVVGFAAVEIYSKKLAEVLCLGVDGAYQGYGIGKRLVAMCVERAREFEVRELMAISSSEGFFRGCGFDFILPDERKVFFIRTGPSTEDEATE
ncbi:MAG: GNAT family N-acetyltransferase [Pirellulales bacterium]